ncbi:MAG: carbon-nitrogen hydrolase family protein [Oscillospiraceae bacterium]|nr:carbon-nitrogen hydrolase family protein [Oscillospiraceae bacterium]
MKSLKVALLQLMPQATQAENLEKGISACKKAKEMGADIALFPEMWNVGYDIPQDADILKTMAVSQDSRFVQTFGKLAAELDMAIAITYLESFDPQPRNTVTLFDRHGNSVLHYAKVHTCDFGDECMLYPGEDFYVADLDTAKGAVKTGAMICYDREFPESGRILMLKGAQLVLVPNACPMEINRLSQLRGRAYENMYVIATCNYPQGKPDCNGHSSVFDGIAYPPDGSGPRDTCLVEAGGEEGIYMADIDMERVEEYRQAEVHGNAFRRPWKYTLLTDENIEYPFIRAENRKIK